ncbi:MAG: L-lactate permease [Armatimonadota bacterium]|nr:L-lactate permease [Armatimonadota bacterium]
MTWTQHYVPIGNVFVSALVAAIPVVVLLGLLAFFHARAHTAALAGLAAALLVAIGVYHMPSRLALASAGSGALFGLFPIGWIVLCAIFVYDITVGTGKFEIIKGSIANLASDRRIQALLIAFSFGAFLEGAAGFGTPVAICAAMLIGLGFKPLQAAALALIGNTAPVGFGALGTPILTLAKVTGLPLNSLSIMVGRQLPVFSLIIPFWLVWAMVGRRRMWEVWPACLATGLSFALVQFLVSNFHGPWLVDIASSIASILSLILLLRFWQPRSVWKFEHDEDDTNHSYHPEYSPDAIPSLSKGGLRGVEATHVQRGIGGVKASPATGGAGGLATPRETLIAWMPWVILTILVFLWGLPPVKGFLDGLSSPKFPVPYLNGMVFRAPPVTPKPKAEEAIFTLNWLSATGTSLLITGVLSGALLGLRPAALLRIFAGTLHRVRFSLLTIAAMLALGFTSRYGGLDATLGLAFASTGALFAFFSPLLGWLGVALTGSDTSSNVLFGSLQQITARQLGLSPILAAAANSSGGVMGKMIDAQSIVVAGVATGQEGGEGDILRYVFFHSVALAGLVGVLIMLQAHVFPGVIP